jgi:AbrB family looped-hinge helix DNA binding protein
MGVAAKITSKSQITLPKEIRKLLHANVGNVVVFDKDGDQVVIKVARTLKEFRGVLKNKGTMDFDEMREKTKKYIGKKVAKNEKY